MKDIFKSARQTLADLTEHIRAIEAEVEQAQARLNLLERSAALSQPQAEAFRAFMQKPYLLRPIKGDRHELLIPRFVDFRAGWPVRTEGEYLVFEVSRFINFLSPLPPWLQQELGYEAPDFLAHLEGDRLVIDEGDPARVWERLGGRKRFTTRIGNELRVRPASRFDLVRQLVRQGILPYIPQPVPQELLREPATSIALRSEQARDYGLFLKYGAVSVFAQGGAGKTFYGLFALSCIKGPKMVVAHRKSILDQWRARVELYCSPEVLAETQFRTYQSISKRGGIEGEYSLIIYDEIHHLPADMGVAAAQARTVARIGLSASPIREDGQEDLIPALCGYPVGFDWPTGEPPDATIWLVDKAEDKLDMVAALAEKPVEGKTLIYVYRLNIGEMIAQKLGVPFVHGKTRNQLEVIQNSDTCVISKVGDEGISVEAVRVIEADFLGGRAEELQRYYRTLHSTHKGEFHSILTWPEYHTHHKRLLPLYGLGVDVRVAGGASDQPPKPRRPRPKRAVTPAPRPAAAPATMSGNGQETGLPMNVQARLNAAKNKVDRPVYVDRVFRACSQAPLSAQEIAEALGTPSLSTLTRITAAVKALLEQGLLTAVENERYRVNQEEVDRLTALAQLGGAIR